MSLPIWAKVGIGWSVATFMGVYGFVLSRKSVNANRYELMKARQRVRESNIGD